MPGYVVLYMDPVSLSPLPLGEVWSLLCDSLVWGVAVGLGALLFSYFRPSRRGD